MRACIIMHNMIVEIEEIVNPEQRFAEGGANVRPSHEKTTDFDEFIENHIKIRSDETHNQL